MTTRRVFLGTLGGGLFAVPLAAETQEAGKVARIGVLGDTSPPIETSYSGIAAFRRGLGDLGYMEGRQVTIEYRWAEGQRDRRASWTQPAAVDTVSYFEAK